MEKSVVIYHSQTGFTKRYAQWLGEALGCPCVELAKAKELDFNEYGTIIFGGWACAGNVSKLKWFKSNMKNWNGKNLAVFCTGASPILTPEAEAAMKNWFGEESERVKTFYCPGGLNYENMPAPSKAAMKMLLSVLKAKKNKTEEDQMQIEMISKSYDIADRKYIAPIVDWAKQVAE